MFISPDFDIGQFQNESFFKVSRHAPIDIIHNAAKKMKKSWNITNNYPRKINFTTSTGRALVHDGEIDVWSVVEMMIIIIIIILMNFYSPVSNTRCHSIGHKMRIVRI